MNNFDDIYNTYQPKLIVLFNKQVRDKDYVEDLVQETLLKVWNKLDSFDDKYSMSTWVYTIAFNTLKNYYKSLKDNVSYSAEIYDNEHTIDPSDPADILSAEQQADVFKQAVGKLETNFLSVYTMREVDGMTYKGISEQLGIPEGTVKSRVKRARDYIKSELS